MCTTSEKSYPSSSLEEMSFQVCCQHQQTGNYIWLHTRISLTYVTYGYIRVTYSYIFVTNIRLHTDYIQIAYRLHTATYELHTEIHVTYKYKLHIYYIPLHTFAYKLLTATYELHTEIHVTYEYKLHIF